MGREETFQLRVEIPGELVTSQVRADTADDKADIQVGEDTPVIRETARVRVQTAGELEFPGTPKASDRSSLPKQTCSRELHLIGTHLCLPGGGGGLLPSLTIPRRCHRRFLAPRTLNVWDLLPPVKPLEPERCRLSFSLGSQNHVFPLKN